MATSPCPNESQLRAYLLGERNSADLEAISNHLERCLDCERVIQSVEGQAESFLGRLQSAFPEGSTSEQIPDDSIVTRPGAGAITDVLPESTYSTKYSGQPDSTVREIIDPRPEYPPAVGTAIRYFGDYEIQSVIGRGGMGVVYRAKQVSLNRSVALKMIKSGVLADDAELRRFQNEAEAVALLDHPGIVPLYEVGDHYGQRYFSMKLIEGGNLADRLASFKDDLGVAVAMLAETTDAVQHAHIRGVLHRDLKPANILVDAARHPHITDFGLAKRLEGNIELTATGSVMGTPAYMSPEQAAGHRAAITTATDVYGLGTILYAMITGKAPFGGDTVMETLDAVRTRLPLGPRKLNAKVHRDLELICLKCLEKNPLDRYPTAAALADDLRRFAAGESASVRAPGFLERSLKWARRKPTLAIAYSLGMLAALLGGLGGLASWEWREAERARQVAIRSQGDAERSQAAEKSARLIALDSQQKAEFQREKFERSEYGRTVQVAHQEWREHNITASLALLGRTNPKLRGWEWNYVNRLCHSEEGTIQHGSIVRAASYSPDGSRIVTASDDGRATVWDAETNKAIFTVSGSRCASFSPDGSRILTVDMSEGWTKLWDAMDGSLISTMRGSFKSVVSACFHPDGSRVITSGYGETRIWDANSGSLIHTYSMPDVSLWVSYSPDGSRFVTAHMNGTAIVWDAATGTEIHRLASHQGFVHSASFSPDGSRIVTASGDGMVRIWDAVTGARLVTIRGHSNEVRSASFSPDGLRIVTGGYDNTARIWDAATGVELLVLKGHTNTVVSSVFSPDGFRIVTASEDCTTKVWDLQTNSEVVTLRPSHLIHMTALFSPDGLRIAIIGADYGAIWDTQTGKVGLDLQGWTVLNNCSRASFSPDGLRIAVGGWDRKLRVWDTRSGAQLLTLQGHEGVLTSASFSPDGLRIVTSSGDMKSIVWDARTGERLLTLSGHSGSVSHASFSPDGFRIVTASSDLTANVWNAVTGEKELTLKGHGIGYGLGILEGVISATFSPDGTRIVTAGLDGTGKVWDARTGGGLLTLEGHTNGLCSASFSPDGTRIVTASLDKSAKVWDVNTGVEVLTLKGHSSGVHSASFSPDGTRIVTASNDFTAKIWDARPLYPKRPAVITSKEFEKAERLLQSGLAAFQQRRFEPAVVDLQRASEQFRSLRTSRPADPQLSRQYGTCLSLLSSSLLELKRLGEALVRFQECLAVLESIKVPLPNDLYNMACACAMISSLNDQTSSGDREKFEARAVEYLRWAIASKTPEIVATVANDRDLDPLRRRADFRDLMADAIFPSNPFVPSPPLLTQADLIEEANSLFAAGQTVEGVRFLSEASKLDPGNAWLLLHVGTLQAWLGQDDEHSATCRRALEFARDTKNGVLADITSKICCLRPYGDKAHRDAALKLAKRAVELGQGQPFLPWSEMAVGIAEYRSGNDE